MIERCLDRVRTATERTQLFASAEARRRVAIHTGIAIVCLVPIVVVVESEFSFVTDVTRLRAAFASVGAFGPPLLVVVQALQVVVAPIPGQVLALVAGYLYGAWLGFLYNMLGITIGSAIAFWLSRRFGRAYVENVIHEETLAKVDGIEDRSVAIALFVSFLIPGLPDDALCFAGGLTTLPLWQLVVLALVGRAPAFLLVNLIGGFYGSGRTATAIALGALFVGSSLVGYLNRERLLTAFE